MADMTKVKRLYDLEIDEISLVDRPANQHGVVAIAKNYSQEEHMTVFAADGTPVAEETLAHGDVVYGQDGTEYVFVEDDDDDDTTAELQSGGDYEYEEEGELVGKFAKPGLLARAGKAKEGWQAQRAGASTWSGSSDDFKSGFEGRKKALQYGEKGKKVAGRRDVQVGSTALLAGGGGYSLKKNDRSLGRDVYEALSKSLGQDERDVVIAKMADQVEVYKAQAEEALEIAQALQDERELQEYTEIAKSYQLPGDPEALGLILKNAAATLPQDQLDYLDRTLAAAGAAQFTELGTAGSLQTSDVLSQVEALAYETVGKADVSIEQATVALFDANPGAYDEYLSERG